MQGQSPCGRTCCFASHACIHPLRGAAWATIRAHRRLAASTSWRELCFPTSWGSGELSVRSGLTQAWPIAKLSSLPTQHSTTPPHPQASHSPKLIRAGPGKAASAPGSELLAGSSP